MTFEKACKIFDALNSACPGSGMTDDHARINGGYWRGVIVGLLFRGVPEVQDALDSAVHYNEASEPTMPTVEEDYSPPHPATTEEM